MIANIKIDLEQTKSRLDFYKMKYKDQPNDIHSKWVEIYQSRVKKLERLFQKENVPAVVMTSSKTTSKRRRRRTTH